MATDDLRFRVRLADYLRSNGLSERAVAAEVLLLLPSEFLDLYEELYLRVWGAPGMSGLHVGDPNAEKPTAVKWRVKSSQVETRGAANKKGGGSTAKGLGVKDARAQATKEWVDRKLRKLGRELRMRMSSDDAGMSAMRRCTGARCRRLADSEWNYCPACGAPTENVEE